MSVKSLLISGSSLLFCFTKSNCCIRVNCKIKGGATTVKFEELVWQQCSSLKVKFMFS